MTQCFMGLGQNGGGEDKATLTQHDRIKYIFSSQDIVIFNQNIPTTKSSGYYFSYYY